MKKITPGEIFNICDDMPSESDTIVKLCCKIDGYKNIETIKFDSSKLNEKQKVFILIIKE